MKLITEDVQNFLIGYFQDVPSKYSRHLDEIFGIVLYTRCIHQIYFG
jgi:hypothetical protein